MKTKNPAAGSPRMKVFVTLLIALTILIGIVPMVRAESGVGSALLQIQGYGTVHGKLENPTIQANNTVSMLLIVNDTLYTPQGSFPLEASGSLNGSRDNSTLSGTIDNLHGTIFVCIVFACNNVYFNGQGKWTGAIDNSLNGAGNLVGTITVTDSPYPQIPKGESIPASGTWTAHFGFTLPEFNRSSSIVILAFLSTALLLQRRSKRN
jgi:hypothetical protein